MRNMITMGSFTGLLLAIAIATAGCSRETPSAEGAFATELKGAPPPGPGAPVAKGGIADDGVKPAKLPVAPVAKGGIADDGIKPAPLPLPLPNTKGGIADDGIKPAPLPLPNTKGGIADDGVKPIPKPAPR